MFENFKVYVNGRRDSEIENAVVNKLSNDDNFTAMYNAFKYYKDQCAKYENEES